MKKQLLSILCLIAFLTSKAQDKKVIISAGAGFPAIIPYLFSKADTAQVDVTGKGPFQVKAEYKLNKHWGVGISSSFYDYYIFLKQKGGQIWINNWDVSSRANYYFFPFKNNDYLNEHLHLYVGGGVGYIVSRQKTAIIDNPNIEPTIVKNNYSAFPVSFEATTGIRYFATKNIGIYSELGLGKFIIAGINKGASDSYIQGGICVQF